MELSYIIKPLSLFWAVPSVNLSKMKRKILGNVQNQTQGCWVQSESAICCAIQPYLMISTYYRLYKISIRHISCNWGYQWPLSDLYSSWVVCLPKPKNWNRIFLELNWKISINRSDKQFWKIGYSTFSNVSFTFTISWNRSISSRRQGSSVARLWVARLQEWRSNLASL